MRRHRRTSASRDELSGQVEQLRNELAELESSPDPIVVFGTHSISRTDAIARTALSIAKLESKIELLNTQVAQIAGKLDNPKGDSSNGDDKRSES
jgi:hypothetical protein